MQVLLDASAALIEGVPVGLMSAQGAVPAIRMCRHGWQRVVVLAGAVLVVAAVVVVLVVLVVDLARG